LIWPIRTTAFFALLETGFVAQAAGSSPSRHQSSRHPHEKQAPGAERHLKTVDTLDLDEDLSVFSNQKWGRVESHAKDIIVIWTDGHELKGIDENIADLREMFVYATEIANKALQYSSARDNNGGDWPSGERRHGTRVIILGRAELHRQLGRTK